MRFDYQRRLAASILGIGVNRVWITTDPKVQDDILDAITRDGIRNLIRKNIIQKRAVQGVSRGRARHRAAQRAKGRRRGHGSRKGALNARTPTKTRWIGVIRGMRRYLRELRDQVRIDTKTDRRLYGYTTDNRASANGVTEAILDLGLQRPSKAGRLFAALRGRLESGVSVPHSPEVLPTKERVRGAHIGESVPTQFDAVKTKLEAP